MPAYRRLLRVGMSVGSGPALGHHDSDMGGFMVIAINVRATWKQQPKAI